jgi:serine/threonine protein kinase
MFSLQFHNTEANNEKGNVLINKAGRAVLADFGMTTASTTEHTSYKSNVGGTARWMAPELLDPDKYGVQINALSKESDIYALGMVFHEVCDIYLRLLG